MPDYADWTESIELLGTEIQVPFDLQGAFIQLPVDIQGQFVDLTVDIVAQSVGNIGIDISAQSIGELTIDVAAQSVGVYLQETWVAKEGDDKNFWADGDDVATEGQVYAEYAVPSGKTLFISHIGGMCYGYAAADRDKDQICEIAIYDATLGNYLFTTGGSGGAFADLKKPIVIASAHVVDFIITNHANHNCNMRIAASGWEQ